MRKALYALIAFLVASIIRLYPTLITDMPFSTDSWPPIRNTELLIERTPVDLGDNGIFDGYNNYWPANSLFGAVFSQVVGLEPRRAMATIFPLIGASAVLIFYVLVEGFFKAETALMASLIFATGFSHAIFTAGITKETYGNPLYLLLVLVFLHLKDGMRKTLLFTLTSVALALAHHLTPLVAVGILFCMALARLLSDLKNGSPLNKLSFLLVGVLAAVTLAYYLLYAQKGFKLQLTLSDWLSAASYQLAAFALATHLAFKKPSQSKTRSLLMCFAALTIPLLSISVAVKTPITPNAPVLPSRYLLYATPFILASPFTYLGYREIKNAHSGHIIEAVFWLASILGLEGYAVFGNSPLGLGLAYRTLNFLWPPLALLSAVGLHQLYIAAEKPRSQKIARPATALILLTLTSIASLNSYNVYAAVSQSERYMGYFWLYTYPEYRAGLWLTNANKNQTVAGDVKASYLLKGYFNMEVDVLQGLKYLTGKDVQKPRLFYTYWQMLWNGYVLYGGYSVDLPKNWTEKLCKLNIVYSNKLVNIYGG
jgi:putative flippase GtrA